MDALSAARRASRSISPAAVAGGMAGARLGPRRDEEPSAREIFGTAPSALVVRIALLAGISLLGLFTTGGPAGTSTTGVVLGRGWVLAMGRKDSSGSVEIGRRRPGVADSTDRISGEFQVRPWKVVALGQQRLTGDAGNGVRQAVAEVEARVVARLPESLPGVECRLPVQSIELDDGYIHRACEGLEDSRHVFSGPRRKHDPGFDQRRRSNRHASGRVDAGDERWAFRLIKDDRNDR